MRRWARYRWWAAGAALVGVLLVVAMRPDPVSVDVATVTRGPMRVTIDEEGETRIRRRYVVSAPVTGRVERIGLEPGDPVIAGRTVVARVRADSPPLLDARARAELLASRASAEAAVGQARAEERRARTSLDFAQKELVRERELDRAGLTSRQALEQRETAAQAAEEAVRSAGYAVATASAELLRIDSQLKPERLDAVGRVFPVLSPVTGVVLRRLRESEATVAAGTPLLELGDPADLEVVSDLLSTDAVQVPHGAVVRLERWGGHEVLTGRVRRVEPSGFMKLSALGVEEQRVNVLIDLDDPVAAAARMGDGFRTEVRIVTWEKDDVVQVPIGALFRRAEAWTVYVLDRDRVRAVAVEVGHRNGQSAEVLVGVGPGDVVVVHPPDTLSDDSRVTRR